MKIVLSTNRSAGFSRTKLFAIVFGILILSDVMFRDSTGMKAILRLKEIVSANEPDAAPTPVTPPRSTPRPIANPTTSAPVALISTSRPAIKPGPRFVAKKVSLLSDGHGELQSATSDKDLVTVNPPSDSRPRMTNPPPVAAHPPLPIALPK